jgi:methionyl aminopeptidase
VLTARNADSNFLGYHGYPGVICASVNDELVHGIPNERPLRDGDIVSIDCGAIVNGWHGDAAFTMGVGASTPTRKRLIDTADARWPRRSRRCCRDGHLGDVGAAVEAVVDAAGIRQPTRVLRSRHRPSDARGPDVENRGRRGKGPRLEPGVVLAIEPMLIAGGRDDVFVLDDDWTVVTADGSLAAHTEHTVVVTETPRDPDPPLTNPGDER